MLVEIDSVILKSDGGKMTADMPKTNHYWQKEDDYWFRDHHAVSITRAEFVSLPA
jgi:hypothetical protein